jgi:hypothetical protein
MVDGPDEDVAAFVSAARNSGAEPLIVSSALKALF